jgi:hypothetical protein
MASKNAFFGAIMVGCITNYFIWHIGETHPSMQGLTIA